MCHSVFVNREKFIVFAWIASEGLLASNVRRGNNVLSEDMNEWMNQREAKSDPENEKSCVTEYASKFLFLD